jgi:hypothetical protein
MTYSNNFSGDHELAQPTNPKPQADDNLDNEDSSGSEIDTTKNPEDSGFDELESMPVTPLADGPGYDSDMAESGGLETVVGMEGFERVDVASKPSADFARDPDDSELELTTAITDLLINDSVSSLPSNHEKNTKRLTGLKNNNEDLGNHSMPNPVVPQVAVSNDSEEQENVVEPRVIGRPKRRRIARNVALDSCLCGNVVLPSSNGSLMCRHSGCETQWVRTSV